MSRFGQFKVASMSLIARFLLGWTALSVGVSPFVGMMLHRLQLDTVAVAVDR